MCVYIHAHTYSHIHMSYVVYGNFPQKFAPFPSYCYTLSVYVYDVYVYGPFYLKYFIYLNCFIYTYISIDQCMHA